MGVKRLGVVVTVFALALGVTVTGATPARADHGDLDLPWPGLLPARPGVPTAVQPHPVPGCVQARIACVERMVAEMTRRWQALDRSCDHRAPFALTYLRTTEGFLATLRRDPGYFDDPGYMVYEDVSFASLYFSASDHADRGTGRVPRAWQIAFDAAARGDTNAGQDVLLGMNAHIQRDLPYVLAEHGLRTPDGATRKPDHDRVNAILSRVLDPIQDELARRYDPVFALTDLTPLPLDELTVLELLKLWREGAWRNAERLLLARTPAQRAAVERSIEAHAATWARALDLVEVPGYGARRDAHCRPTSRQAAA